LFSANSRYIFNISKKTGIFTRVKMPVYRQSEAFVPSGTKAFFVAQI
jgi:hypothetical protein